MAREEVANIKHWPTGTWFQKRLAEVKMREATETLSEEGNNGTESGKDDND